MTMVHIPEVRAVVRSAGQDARRNGGRHLAGVGKQVCGRFMNWD
jgi:hypothetical protein